MLFRSLDKAMQADGYSISDIVGSGNGEEPVNASDVLNGYIYVLRSLNPTVKNIPDLYKIGYTTGLVAERIKNAKNEPTYLFSDVEVVSTFRCLNIESYNLEQTIHGFFANTKLEIELMDRSQNAYKPREWFKVNIGAIEDAISLILKKEIANFEYDPKIDQIIKKRNL